MDFAILISGVKVIKAYGRTCKLFPGLITTCNDYLSVPTMLKDKLDLTSWSMVLSIVGECDWKED